MPNIIINNYCNQNCSYCFAYENMKNKDLQKDMNLLTYLKVLKYLKINNEKEVRLLWGEPLLSPNIRKFFEIANKWWFGIIVFSNINIDNKKIKKIFSWLNINNIRINCNINNEKFYTKKEIKNLWENLKILNKLWLKVIIWYNVLKIDNNINFIFNLAKENNISAINIKITNSSLWWNILIDNLSKKLWDYLFKTIKKYHKDFFIEFSCWLDKNIFSNNKLEYIKKETNIKLKYWCEWNIWRFDINTNWSFFKCFPLEKLFKQKKYSKLNLNYSLLNNIYINQIIEIMNNLLLSYWECIANKKLTKYKK